MTPIGVRGAVFEPAPADAEEAPPSAIVEVAREASAVLDPVPAVEPAAPSTPPPLPMGETPLPPPQVTPPGTKASWTPRPRSIPAAPAASMAYSFFPDAADGGLMVLVHTDRAPSDAEWDAYCNELTRYDVGHLKSLVLTEGGGPDASQRKRVNALLAGRESRGAVVSSNTLIRGIVIALSWFNSQIKSFTPNEIGAALAYLGVPFEPRAKVFAELTRLREGLERTR
jgi:hypothetical protein